MSKKITEQEPIVYIGDNLPALGLLKDTVYTEQVPQVFREKMEEIPAFARLFVPISQLMAKKQALLDKGSIEFLSKEEVKERLGKRGE